ncbi:hypothetical protein O181_101517 [Austropuccinia psidii MF-1]|uniref:Uncharacterized protein n=1 Tax=Austropuccinia psidii MF-1 TaxID=1389203 RepID=A0A9Q3PIL8_9BASI|nr:hypothetical protein [Austropuccinia psidii MF-1]
MSYSEKESLKQLPEALSWPKLYGIGEYDYMKLIYYIDGLFIDVPSIPDYCITAILNTASKGHASIWYTEMREIHGRRNWPWWKSQIIQKSSNGKEESLCFWKVQKEESPKEDSETDPIGAAIREQSDDYQKPREEFLVEYQEETQLDIQDIQLDAGIQQDTANKILCKHTQDAQTFLVTPTKQMAYLHGTATKMTVCIDNAQHLLISESGEHLSIVAIDYLDNHSPNWEKQVFPTKAKDFNSASGKIKFIGTNIK